MTAAVSKGVWVIASIGIFRDVINEFIIIIIIYDCVF